MIRSVVVLGMHRSGTSLVAGMLHFMGVHMGDRLLQADNGNPFGYFENWEFVGLNNIILYAAGGSYLYPPTREEILSLKPKFETAIRVVIRANERSPFWGFKDPRTCLTVELYHPFLKNPFYIICERNPRSIVRSFVEREKISEDYAWNLVNTYMQRIQFFVENYNVEYAIFEYENPIRTIRHITDRLGIEVTEKALRLIKPRWKVKLAKRTAYWCDFIKGALKIL